MRMLYKPGSMFEFQGIMLDCVTVSDEEVEKYESEGWGCAWSFLEPKEEIKKDNLPDGGEYERELRDKIKSLGGKPAGRSSIATLEAQLEELEAKENGDESAVS